MFKRISFIFTSLILTIFLSSCSGYDLVDLEIYVSLLGKPVHNMEVEVQFANFGANGIEQSVLEANASIEAAQNPTGDDWAEIEDKYMQCLGVTNQEGKIVCTLLKQYGDAKFHNYYVTVGIIKVPVDISKQNYIEVATTP